MRQEEFGSLLADARVRYGYTVDDIANQLRIRVDIVCSIEESDLNSLPPRAYTRSMIAQYARIVHLDPELIVNMYENSSYSIDIMNVRSNRESSQKSGQRGTVTVRPASNQGDYSRSAIDRQYSTPNSCSSDNSHYGDSSPLRMPTSRMSSAYSIPQDKWNTSSSNRYSNSVSGRISLDMNDDDITSRGYGSSSQVAKEGGSSRRYSSSNAYDDSSIASVSNRSSRRSSSRKRRGSGSSTPSTYAENAYSSKSISRANSTSRSKKPFVLILAIILVIVIAAVVFAVVSSGKAKANDSTTKAPITGLTDTTSTDSAESVAIPIAPTSVEFAYSVNSGVETYIEVYLDDSDTATLAQVVNGPSKGSYTVTGKLKFVCTQPDGVKLTVDGVAVEMTPGEETSWLYEYELDFSEYLAKWQEEHAEEIAAAEKAKAELLASQQAASASPSSGSGSSSTSSTSGKTTTSR